jgi:hypothetical protein
MYYRRRFSNKALSGEFAHLNGKRITWEESHDGVEWMSMEGIIKVVGRNARQYYVEEGGYRLYWIEADPQRIRNIQIATAEQKKGA